MNGTCTIHDNALMTERTSKTKFDNNGNPKTYFAHNAPDGKLCFGESIKKSQNNNRAYTAPAKPESQPVEEVKVDWDAKDRQSLAQTAMKSASEIVAAMINAGLVTSLEPSIDVKAMANDFYKELKAMKKDI